MKSVLRLVPLLFFAQMAYSQELSISIRNEESQSLACVDMPVTEILPGQTVGCKISIDKSKTVAFKKIGTGPGYAGYKYIVRIIPFAGGAFFAELFENQKGGGSTPLTIPDNRDLLIVIDKTGQVARFTYEIRIK